MKSFIEWVDIKLVDVDRHLVEQNTTALYKELKEFKVQLELVQAMLLRNITNEALVYQMRIVYEGQCEKCGSNKDIGVE